MYPNNIQDDSLDGVLRLQLRKPKNWRWELTTTKSSPNIAMPIIQLLNNHGKILTEANDPNGCCRRSWHSEDEQHIKVSKIKKRHSFNEYSHLKNDNFYNDTNEINIDNFLNPNDVVKNKKYKLRSSRAGTLIVSDDSFEKRPRKHRSTSLIDTTDLTLNKFGNYFQNDTIPETENPDLVHRPSQKPKYNSNQLQSTKSNEIYPLQDYRLFKKYPSPRWDDTNVSVNSLNFSENLNEISKYDVPFNTKISDCNSFSISNRRNPKHSKSDSNVSQLTNVRATKSEKIKNRVFTAKRSTYSIREIDLNSTENKANSDQCQQESKSGICEQSNYTVKEPDTPIKSMVKQPNFPSKKKVKRKLLRRHSFSDTSSSESNAEELRQHKVRRKRKGDRVLEIDKKPVSDIEAATTTLKSASDVVLLRLVRRLTTTDSHETEKPEDVTTENNLNTMGANVSRHSGKGLSGRRTQSSGNICNGKSSTSNVSKFLGPCATVETGTTPTSNNVHKNHRFCGSLPNHLDDTDSLNESNSICYAKENNNHVEQIVKVAPRVPKKHPAPPIPPLQNYKTRDPDVELRLQPLHVKVGNDATCDQGYGSERSPEDEYPPVTIPSGSESGTDESDPHSKYSFIIPESTFTVTLTKNSRGLGLSVTGGIDSGGPWPGLIRIKRLFPNQPAASCGLLSTGDLILAANGLTLTGLTNYEALEVLRTTPATVILTICRPPEEILNAVSPLSDIPPPPPKRDPPCSLNLLPSLTPYEDCYTGEFDIVLTKVQGSLGFTLRKEDESALGHYVRALVREPALSDGRIKPGDKIVAVNDVELSAFSHEEAVQFLRQCGQEVKLRLYRDAAQTPVTALSPTEPDAPTKLKPLRQEAMDMLSDLAVRKLSPGSGNLQNNENSCRTNEDWSSINTNSTPRKLRRTQKTTPTESEGDGSLCNDDKGSYRYISSQVTSESDSFSRKASIGSDVNTNISSNESEPEKPIRPNFLNLCSPVSTPTSRKPKFQFSLAHNAYELNNLDADILDAPNLTFNKESYDETNSGQKRQININETPDEPVSMPQISSKGFTYNNPSYQSAHPKCGTSNDTDESRPKLENGSKGLLKWKGIVFTPESSVEDPSSSSLPKRKILHTDGSDFEIITIELNRGWNSRLGFSLQQGENGETFVSAVHSDSVAARDGRLKAGDQLLRVNDENIENMTTNNVIDLLRIVRGPVCIVVARKIV